MIERTVFAAVLSVALLIVPATPHADEAEDFFRGKTLTYLVGGSAGGILDLYARVSIPYLKKNLPGDPTIIVQNMSGAGGAKSANYFANIAPQDGSVIWLALSGLPLNQIVRGTSAKYDLRKMHWLGRYDSAVGLLVTMASAPAKTLEDLKRTETVLAASGKGSVGYYNPALATKLLGMKFKVVTGYRGSNKMFLAMERGEVHGTATTTASLKSIMPAYQRENKVRTLLLFNPRRSPEFPDVPTAMELAKDPKDKAIFYMISRPNDFGRGVAAPPPASAPIVAAWRQAFDKSLTDPGFLDEARQRKIDVDYLPGKELQEIVDEIISTPQDVVRRTRALIGIGKGKKKQ